MIIKVDPTQIPKIWEPIKFVALETDKIEPGYYQDYCNELLVKLLTGSLMVMVKLDGDQIIQLAIFEYQISELSGDRTLNWKNFYSWKGGSKEEWQEAFETLISFAKADNCKWVNAVSYNSAVWKLAESVGFEETSRQYLVEV